MKTLLLALTMNVAPVAPIDILRFLRVPAIVWVMRRRRAERHCSDPAAGRVVPLCACEPVRL